MKIPILAASVLLAVTGPVLAQQQPVPLFNTLPANPPSPVAAPPTLPDQGTPPAPAGRDFCGQNVTAQPADPGSVPDRYREFVGIFSDAAWNAQLCAALVVEKIGDDGTAII